MKINLVTPIEGFSGISMHGKNIALAMDEIGMDISVETSFMSPTWEREIPERLRKLVLKDYRNDGIQIMNTPPPSAYIKSGDRVPIWQYVIFEGSKIPLGWKLALNKPHITKILVPSKHTEKSVRAAGVDKPIHIISHGVNTNIFNIDNKSTPDIFTFIWCKGWAIGERDRSGLDLFLKAFANEFKNEKVKSVIKINPSYAQMDYSLAIRNMRLDDHMKNKLYINSQLIPEGRLAQIYKSGDCFVSVSKADAFDMGVAEAMACGLAPIVSDHNGHTDYINNELGWIVKKGEFVQATDPNVIYEEAKWWITDLKALQNKLRYAFDNQDEVRKKGQKAAKFIKDNYQWKHSAEKIKRLLT